MISEDEVKDLAVASDPPVLSSDPNYSSPESHQAPSRAHCDGFKNKRRKHYFFSIKKYVEKIIPSIMLGCTLKTRHHHNLQASASADSWKFLSFNNELLSSY